MPPSLWEDPTAGWGRCPWSSCHLRSLHLETAGTPWNTDVPPSCPCSAAGTVRVSSTLPKHLVQLELLFVKVTLEGSVVRRDGSRERLCGSGIAHLWKISEVMLAYSGLSSSQGGPWFLICLASKFLPFLALVLFFLFSLGPLRYWSSLYLLTLWLCVQAGFHPPSLLVAEELVAVEQVFWIWGPKTMGCFWASWVRVYEHS